MSEKVTVSFPGLGIGEFTLNKIAFTLFGKLEVRWYGLIITAGIIFAFLYTIWRGKQEEKKITSDDVIDVGLLTVLLGIIGARLYYVLTDSGNTYDSFLDVIAICNGGIAIYGSLIGGAIGVLIMCRVKKIPFLKFADLVAPGVMFAQTLGRWGNFCNGEAYGYVIGDTTKYYFFLKEFEFPGKLFNVFRMGLLPNEISGSVMHSFHPTFLYESVWNLIGFVILNLLYKKKKYNGKILFAYIAWYGFGRMLIEGFRTDSLYIHGTSLRISQCVGLICFIAGVALLVTFGILSRKRPPLAASETGTDSPADAPAPEAAAETAPATEPEISVPDTDAKKAQEKRLRRIDDLMERAKTMELGQSDQTTDK